MSTLMDGHLGGPMNLRGFLKDRKLNKQVVLSLVTLLCIEGGSSLYLRLQTVSVLRLISSIYSADLHGRKRSMHPLSSATKIMNIMVQTKRALASMLPDMIRSLDDEVQHAFNSHLAFLSLLNFARIFSHREKEI